MHLAGTASLLIVAGLGTGGPAWAQTVDGTPVPEPPTVLEEGVDTLNVTWKTPADRGTEITGYDLQYRQGTSGDWTDGPRDQTGTEAKIGGLLPDRDYQVQVRARIGANEGEWSEAGAGRTALWAATLTVEENPDASDRNEYWGFRRVQFSKFGKLSPRWFKADGTEYSVTVLAWCVECSFKEFYSSRFDLYIRYNAIPNDWTLRVGTVRFHARDGTRVELQFGDRGIEQKLYWPDPDIGLVPGESYGVSLARDVGSDATPADPFAPLTARFDDVPDRHDASSPFQFKLRFNEETDATRSELRGSAFEVTGGSVTNATRLDRYNTSNQEWEITVRPSGYEDVSIVLPADRPCDGLNAICSTGGKLLSASVEATVTGPPPPVAPEIAGSRSFTVVEGDSAVAALSATDADTPEAALTWSIPPGPAGGTDGTKFALTGGGVLSFGEAKDYEDPDDADTDGVYAVTVQVSDGGLTATADLTVSLSNRNEPPVADAGESRNDMEEGATVTLRGAGVDPDAGDTLSYGWTQTGGSPVALSSPSAPTATFGAPIGLDEAATLTFSLRVTDAGGLQDEDQVSITALPARSRGDGDAGAEDDDAEDDDAEDDDAEDDDAEDDDAEDDDAEDDDSEDDDTDSRGAGDPSAGGGGSDGGGGSGGGGSPGGGGGGGSPGGGSPGGGTPGGGAGTPKAAIATDAACEGALCRARTDVRMSFRDASTGTVRTRRWDFSDGRQPRGGSVSHAWSSPGFYEVTLWTSDGREESTASLTFLVEASAPAGACEADAETLCLRDSRYAVRLDRRRADGERAAGTVVHAGTNDSGLFSFFGRSNWEVLIKVLDGCARNGNVWVMGASTTDLGYVVSVTDTVTGEVREYGNEPGQPAPAILDVTAFPRGCDAGAVR